MPDKVPNDSNYKAALMDAHMEINLTTFYACSQTFTLFICQDEVADSFINFPSVTASNLPFSQNY